MTKKTKNLKQVQSDDSSSADSYQKQPIDQQDLQDTQNDKILETEPDNTQIPFQNFRKSFNIFTRKTRSLQFKSYAKFKSQAAFLYFKQSFSQISGQYFQYLISNKSTEKIPPIAQDNIFACQIPSKSSIFIHIYKIDNRKCHIRVMNASGYVYAYFVETPLSRKFSKLYKILKKIQKQNYENLFMIYDQTGFAKNQLNFVTKIADLGKQFCYYFYSDPSSINLLSTSLKLQKKQNHNFLHHEHFFCFHSCIFTQKEDTPLNNIIKMIELQKKIQNPPQFAVQNLTSLDFIFQSIFINFSKFFKYEKKQMYPAFKLLIENFEQTINKKKQIVYGDPSDHYPEKMETCKECVHCPFNKERINQMYRQKQKSTSESLHYDYQKGQVKQKNYDQNYFKQNKKSKPAKNKNEKKKKNNQDQDDMKLKIHKSKYRCQGCSAEAKKDIPLCLECFKDYHSTKEKKNKKRQKKLKKAEAKTQTKPDQIMEAQTKESSCWQIGDLNKKKVQNKLQSQDQVERIKIQSQEFEQLTKKDFIKPKEYIEICKEINRDRENFLSKFSELYADPATKNMSLKIVEFVQFNIASMLSCQKDCFPPKQN